MRTGCTKDKHVAPGGESLHLPGYAILLIPAFRPDMGLLDLVRAIAGQPLEAIVLVDDGSGEEFRAIFDEAERIPGVRVVRHAVNLGKGAALKTGMNFALAEYPKALGIVTADADGQHDPADIQAVTRRFQQNSDSLVLGSRGFSGNVPVRSRLGNSITRTVMRFAVGHRLIDTQTGLRAVSRELAERLLSIRASGYEFELEMLIVARYLGINVIEEPIRTIYRKGNPTSHFQPLRDSMRIYFVLLRFTFLSMATAALDNVAFYVLFHTTGVLTASLFGARLMSAMFNYAVARRAVFLSRAQHRTVLPRYFLLVGANVVISYCLISFLTINLPIPVMWAKIGVEACLFIANFALQRDFIFARRAQ